MDKTTMTGPKETVQEYWRNRELPLRRALEVARQALPKEDYKAQWAELTTELNRVLPKLFQKVVDRAGWKIVLGLKAGRHSTDAARMLTGKLQNGKGRLQLMMYAGNSGNREYPQQVWLAPSPDGTFYSRSFKGLKQERLAAGHPMITVYCVDGENDLALYTIYPACDGSPAEWQVHFEYGYSWEGKSCNMGDLFPALFAKHTEVLGPVLGRFRNLVLAERDALQRREHYNLVERRLNTVLRQRVAWEKVSLPDSVILELLKLAELFENDDPAKPQGLLLKGPPGTGKTRIAEIMASAVSCKFLSLSLADLKHPEIGKSGQYVRKLWQEAREQPTIMFIDECESVFGKRGACDTDAVATDVVQAFLSEWNGKDKNVWVIGATNRRDMLDEAIISRIGLEMEIPLPNEQVRMEILRRELAEIGFKGEIPAEMGKATQGLSGRDLMKLARKIVTIAHPRIPGRDDFLSAVRAFRVAGNTQVDSSSSWETLIVDDATLDKLRAVCSILGDVEGWREQGVTPPDGILLEGPPGTGKTEIARTLANESGLAFIAATSADVKAGFIGQSGNRVKNLFERARAAAPCLLFLDELDVIAPARTGGSDDSFTKEIIGELLQQISGIRSKSGHVFLLGATNHADSVDPAILDRFTEKIWVPLPDFDSRHRYLSLVLGKKKAGFDVGVAVTDLARQSEGMSKRALRNWVVRADQRAILRANKEGGPKHYSLLLDDFLAAR